MLNCYSVNTFKYGISRYINIDKHEIHCRIFQKLQVKQKSVLQEKKIFKFFFFKMSCLIK